MKRNRLVLFCSEFPSEKGETFLHNEMHYLSEKFDKISVITESVEISSKFENVQIFNLKRTKHLKLKNLFSGLLWKEILRNGILNFSKNKIALGYYLLACNVRNFTVEKFKSGEIKENDIFYTYWMNESALAMSMIKKSVSGIKFYSRVHGWDLYQERHPFHYLPFRHTILKTVNKVLSISNNGVEYLGAKYPEFKEKLTVSRLGVETLNTESTVKTRDDKVFRVVSCSSIIPLKRVDMIANVIMKIDRLNLEWIHFGDGPCRTEVENIISEYAINGGKAKLLLKGIKSNDEIHEFYMKNSIDLFMNLSQTEGIPVSIMEAMSYGIPVLATDVGGTSEIVIKDYNGILIDENSSLEAISEEIVKLMEKREKINSFSQNAIELYNLKYNAKNNYSSLCKQLLNG